MVEKPDFPHRINQPSIQPIPPKEEKPGEPTKKFLNMNMTQKQYHQFLNGFVKMMLSLIKSGEKKMISAMKKIGDPDHPG